MPPLLMGPFEGFGVLGTGTAFPELELDNEAVLRDLSSAAWSRRANAGPEELHFLAASMETTMGVRRRRWTHRVGQPFTNDEATSLDLGVAAARRALEDARVSAGDIGLVLCTTSTPHRMTSTLAAPLSAALGIRTASLDVRGGCSGGLFALASAALFHQSGQGPVLIVGAETFSKVVPPSSKVAALSLADGAGALVVGGVKEGSLESIFYETDGALGKLLSTDGSLPPTVEEIARGGYFLSGTPDEFIKVVPEKYLIAIRGALGRAGRAVSDIDAYVPHQPGRPIIEWVAQQLGFPPEKVFTNVERHANVGAPGWMVALSEARAEGRAGAGKRLLIASVGGGMSYGAAVLRCG